MKKLIFLLVLFLSTASDSNAQANGSFFTLKLGRKTCLFKYTQGADSMRALTLMDSTSKSVDIKYSPRDTVDAVNPQTGRHETKIISYPSFDYHFETTMTYMDFLLLLKEKFELSNPQKKLRVYSYNIYYETPDTGGIIRVKYPQTSEGVISKLNCLDKGGFVLLSLKEADHGAVKIDAGGTWLAMIHIRK